MFIIISTIFASGLAPHLQDCGDKGRVPCLNTCIQDGHFNGQFSWEVIYLRCVNDVDLLTVSPATTEFTMLSVIKSTVYFIVYLVTTETGTSFTGDFISILTRATSEIKCSCSLKWQTKQWLDKFYITMINGSSSQQQWRWVALFVDMHDCICYFQSWGNIVLGETSRGVRGQLAWLPRATPDRQFITCKLNIAFVMQGWVQASALSDPVTKWPLFSFHRKWRNDTRYIFVVVC